jgi:hypothetical protein
LATPKIGVNLPVGCPHKKLTRLAKETSFMKLLKPTLTVLVLLAPLAALAQTAATPRFDQRQLNQEQRIQQGAQSGALTAREAASLERGQGRLQAREDHAKADGLVTPQERKNLQRAEDRQSRRIYEEKHDRQHDFNHDGKMDRPRGRR